MPDPVQVAILAHSAIANYVLRYCLGHQPDLQPVMLDLRSASSRIDVFLVHALLSRRLRDGLISHARSTGGGKLVLLGAPSDPQRLASFLQQGYSGYVKNGESFDTLLDVIRQVVRGEPRLEDAVVAVMMTAIRTDSSA